MNDNPKHPAQPPVDEGLDELTDLLSKQRLKYALSSGAVLFDKNDPVGKNIDRETAAAIQKIIAQSRTRLLDDLAAELKDKKFDGGMDNGTQERVTGFNIGMKHVRAVIDRFRDNKEGKTDA